LLGRSPAWRESEWAGKKGKSEPERKKPIVQGSNSKENRVRAVMKKD